MTAPLEGVTIVELAGIGPAPYAGMVLADMGARVVRVDRVGGDVPLFPGLRTAEVLERGKQSIEVDLKADEGRQILLDLVAVSDALIEGFRPGVTERLGIGPTEAHAVNPALVYGRVTGWGQTGELAATAGHDIDYIAVAGALGAIGAEDPVVPLNLIGDFGGGGMFLVAGVLAGIVRAHTDGVGTIVDAAMVDGVASLMTMIHGGIAAGWWTDSRRSNPLDGAAPFYSVYRTSEGLHIAVGALEPRFFVELIAGLGLELSWVDHQYEPRRWADMRRAFEVAFGQRTRDEWVEIFAGTDACVAPVLSLHESVEHPHLRSRATFIEVDGVIQPSPAPRFSDGSTVPSKPVDRGENTVSILTELGYSVDRIDGLRSRRTIG